jgi:hypothetical protein
MTLAFEVQRVLWYRKEDSRDTWRLTHLMLAYSYLGSIRDCGIDVLEVRAAMHSEHLQKPELQEQIKEQSTRFAMSPDLIAELVLREWLLEDFEETLGDLLDSETKKTLKYIMFDIAYPLEITKPLDQEEEIKSSHGGS